LRKTGRFALSELGSGDQALMSQFLKRPPEGASPFDVLAVPRSTSGLLVLEAALAWLHCRIAGKHAAGDHTVLFGVVEEAQLVREGDPRIHLRRNGLGY